MHSSVLAILAVFGIAGSAVPVTIPGLRPAIASVAYADAVQREGSAQEVQKASAPRRTQPLATSAGQIAAVG